MFFAMNLGYEDSLSLGIEDSLVTTSFAEVESEAGQHDKVLFVYMAAISVLVILVTGVYHSRGMLVVSRILAYLLALSTMTLAVKNVYVTNHFKFPKFISVMHFMSAGLLCFSIMFFRRQTHGKSIPVPSLSQFFGMILPISLSFAMSIGLNNLSLVYANAGFVEMVGSCGPICIVICSLCMGKKFDLKLLWPVLVVCFGVCLCATGELKFSILGFSLAFFGTFSRAIKATLQHGLMDSGESALDPIELLAWMSPPSIAIMLIWSVFTEGIEPWELMISDKWLSLVLNIGLTCINACILNVANLFVIKDLGAVATQLAGQLKGVLIVLGGVALLGENVQLMQINGYAFIISGVFWYNRTDQALKAATEKIKKAKLEEAAPLLK